MKIYNDLDLQGNKLIGVANLPNDLLDVKLLHADLAANPPLVPTYAETSQGSGVYEWTDIPEYGAVTPVGTENPSEEGWYTRSGSGTELDPYVYTLTTDTTVVSGTTYYRAQQVERFAALCFAYRASDGSIVVTAVSIADFLQEAEFKNGLEVTNSGEVNVKIDPTSESYLTVGANGVKLSGISSALSSLDIDHITVPRDIYTYYNIGKIQNASGTTPQKVASSGNTLKQLFDNLFNMDELQPSITNAPSISIAISQPSTANKLIGTHLSSVSYTITTYNGKYTYQADGSTGVTWTNSYDLTGSDIANTTVNSKTGTLSLTSDYVVGKTSSAFTFGVEGSHSAGTVAKTNLGNDSNPEVKIAAGTKTGSGSFSVSAIYPAYYGFCSSNDADDAQSMLSSLTQISKATSGVSGTTYDLSTVTNEAGNGKYFWMVTKGDSTAESLTVSVVNAAVSKTLTVPSDSTISMGTYKVYISKSPYDLGTQNIVMHITGL